MKKVFKKLNEKSFLLNKIDIFNLKNIVNNILWTIYLPNQQLKNRYQ